MCYNLSMNEVKKLISWNVNGVRAWHKKGASNYFFDENPDIFCMQEIKAEADQVPEEVSKAEGYFSYFSSSKARKGYSGVAVLSKEEPILVEYGLGIDELDQEGRLLLLDFGDWVLLNCYFPNGGGGPERLAYKFRYYKAFLNKVNSLRKSGKSVVFCGDVNTAHTEIDLARPKANVGNTGFLPEERAWIDEVITAGYIDSFRLAHPGEVDRYSYWDMKTRARDRNVGWRIDYFFISEDLAELVAGADIHDQVIGSDHCPTSLSIAI